MLRLAHFGNKGGKQTFAAFANLMGHTPEADLQPEATTFSFLRCGGPTSLRGWTATLAAARLY
jgi:hypothetical protein